MGPEVGLNAVEKTKASGTVPANKNPISWVIHSACSQATVLWVVFVTIRTYHRICGGVQCYFLWGYVLLQLVEAFRYNLGGRGFDSRICHLNFSLNLSFRPH